MDARPAMKHSVSRTRLLAASLAVLLGLWTLPARAGADPGPPLREQLAQLEKSANGRLGLACIDAGSGRRFQYRGDERFPFCSTFKLLLAAAILKKSMAEPGLLDKHVDYRESDLLSHAPVTREHLRQGLSIARLCAAALQYSDNTAANLLLEEIGGVEAVNRFARSLGDRAFRLDRLEPDLNTARPNDPRDTTTPAAMAASVETVVLGSVLAPPQREALVAWLKGNTTGSASIRAGVPSGWAVGDKTGSGDFGTTNDVAVLWPPRGGPLVLAVYFTQPRKDALARRDVLAAAARLVLQHFP